VLLPSVFQIILESTAALENVGIIRVVIAFTHHLDFAQPIAFLQLSFTSPLGIHAVPSGDGALHNVWLIETVAKAVQLRDGGRAAAGCHLAPVKRERSNIFHQNLFVVVVLLWLLLLLLLLEAEVVPRRAPEEAIQRREKEQRLCAHG